MIEFEANFDAVAELMGALQGVAVGLDEQSYLGAIIRDAHHLAANAFDIAAAATTQANGSLNHVYEFGVAGITAGPPRISDPTSQEARLYEHTITGIGGTQDIGYTFRPARVPNPQPTTASTGVESKYLQKLSGRKYIFWNKAFVMETGQEVDIHAKHGDYLFVPFYGDTALDPKNSKGFVLWNSKRLGPILTNPGKTVKGNFTQFWMLWWEADGNKIMSGEMSKYINYDIEKAVAEAARAAEAATMKPVQSTNITAAASKARNLMKRLFGAGRKERSL